MINKNHFPITRQVDKKISISHILYEYKPCLMKQKHLPGVGFLVVVVGLNAAGNAILYSQCIVLESILVLYNSNHLKSKLF